MLANMLAAEDDRPEGEPLIQPVMACGRRLAPQVSLGDIRANARRQLERLPLELDAFRPLVSYRAQVCTALEQLAAVADWRTSLREQQP